MDVGMYACMCVCVSVVMAFCSGDANGLIQHNDVRQRDPVIATSRHHQLEVCGLQWSPDGSKLASGANDNMVCIWRARSPAQPAQLLSGHKAAVKVCASKVPPRDCSRLAIAVTVHGNAKQRR